MAAFDSITMLDRSLSENRTKDKLIGKNLTGLVKDAGIIFVKSIDPLSWLHSSFAKSEYSSIGFYYTTAVSGVSKVEVILFDLFTCDIPLWLEGSIKKSIDLSELINHPLISKIAVKKLKNTKNHDSSKFRESIIKIVTTHKGKTLKSSIKEFINLYWLRTYDRSSIISIINEVIFSLTPDFNVKNIPSMLERSVLTKGTLNDKLDLFENPTKNIINRLVRIYLVNSPLFDELKIVYDIDTSFSEATVIRSSLLPGYLPIIKSIINEFVKLLFENPDLLSLMVTLGPSITLTDSQTKELIFKMISDISILMSLIKQWIEKGASDYEDILKIALDIEINRHSLSKAISIENEPMQLPLVDKPKLLVLRKADKTKNPRLFTDILTDIQKQLTKMTQSINEGQLVHFDINNMIEQINDMSTCLGTDNHIDSIVGEYAVNGMIVVTKTKSLDVPLQLTSGRRIVIPTRDFDLSEFTTDEIREILGALDGQIEENNVKHFHDLRRALIKMLY